MSTTTATGSVTTPPGTTTATGPANGGCTLPTPALDTAGFTTCDWALEVPGFLDPLQAPDGRTIFCHHAGGTDYVYNNLPYADCAAHLGHPCDLFPTWGC